MTRIRTALVYKAWQEEELTNVVVAGRNHGPALMAGDPLATRDDVFAYDG